MTGLCTQAEADEEGCQVNQRREAGKKLDGRHEGGRKARVSTVEEHGGYKAQDEVAASTLDVVCVTFQPGSTGDSNRVVIVHRCPHDTLRTGPKLRS